MQCALQFHHFSPVKDSYKLTFHTSKLSSEVCGVGVDRYVKDVDLASCEICEAGTPWCTGR